MFKLCLIVVAALALGPQAVKGIVGGEPASLRDIPYHVLMKLDDEFFCNGALISSRLVLTAAYCIFLGECNQRSRHKKGVITAVVGTEEVNYGGAIHEIVETGTYTSSNNIPDYTIVSEPRPDEHFNLGIYTLLIDVTGAPRPVNLPSLPSCDPVDDLEATISAAGPPSAGEPFSTQVQKLKVRTMTWVACQQRTIFFMSICSFHICASPLRGKKVTKGDLGGPLVSNGVIIGVAAHSRTVDVNDSPYIFINVGYFRSWIDYIIQISNDIYDHNVLQGNSNTYLVAKQKLDLPFVASRVRFVPYSQHPRTVCMRVEIYGCVWEQRIARYTIPAGEVRGPGGCNVEDSSYDGSEVNGTLANGLGQLTDNIVGDGHEILASSSGSSWVGWSHRDMLELIFEFKEPREFDSCSLHVAHVPRREVEVFAWIQAWFSPDGKQYQASTEKIEIASDFKSNAGMVTIPLQLKAGRFVKLEIKPRSKWLLISEVIFESGLRNLSNELTPEQNLVVERNETNVPEQSHPNRELNDTIYEPNPNLTPDAFPIGNSQTYIGLVSGALTVIALLLTCTVFLMKQRGRNKVALLQKHTALLCGPTAPGITINMKDIKLAAPIMPNGLSQSRLSLKSKGLASALAAAVDGDPLGTLRSSTRSDNGSEYEQCSAYERTYKLFSEENLAYEPTGHKSDRFSTCSGVTDFASDHTFPDDKSSERIASTPFPAKRHGHGTTKSNHKVHEGYYAATDILTIKRREQHSTSSLFTPLQIQESAQLSNTSSIYNIQQISRHRLRILDKFGEGSFGLVYLCEAKGIQSPDMGTIRNRQIVIVRSLWRGVTDSLKKDFMKDMHLLAAIRDLNVARIIALVEEEPMGAVFEYGELGDFPTFMKSGSERGNEELTLTYGCLLNFITQIASGMKYLENLKIPHCDLAARNCIVNKNLIIKVSDHAMYCGKYDHEYYVNGYYAKIPLRWMAWEAVLMGKCSSQSDVWSYAVTAWEIFSSCSELPYAELTSEQVLENCSRWYQSGSPSGQQQQLLPRVLPQPALCPRELYRMMSKCWSRRAEDRPNFEEIYLFLKRLAFD